MWTIFQTEQIDLKRECDMIYEENIQMLYWFLKVDCGLLDAECHVVLMKLMRKLGQEVKTLHGMTKDKQSDWLRYKSYRIARLRYKKVPKVYEDAKKIR